MLNISKLLNLSNRRSSQTAWEDIARTLGPYREQDAAVNASAQQGEALQMLMAELVKGKAGVRPDEPLHLESEDGLPTWLTEAWAFIGFHIVSVSKAQQGSIGNGVSTRYEFVPMTHR